MRESSKVCIELEANSIKFCRGTKPNQCVGGSLSSRVVLYGIERSRRQTMQQTGGPCNGKLAERMVSVPSRNPKRRHWYRGYTERKGDKVGQQLPIEDK